MLAFRFIDKIKEIEHLIYLDKINNSLVYHGISINGKNIILLNKNVLNEIYNVIRINDNSIFLRNNGNYDIYYDKDNDLYHYIKDNREDLLMFLLSNSKSAVLHSDRLKPHNDKDKYIKISKKGFTIVGNIIFIFALLTSNIGNVDINNDVNIGEISYVTVASENNIENVSVETVKNMIYSSELLNDDEKNFFYNYELLSDITPYYKNTSMEYIIKDRLNEFGIVYDELESKKAGVYYGTNKIILSDDFKDISILDDYKASVLGHEFIHVLQADSYLYLKETSAEVISSEYYNREAYAYNDACLNFKLLVETLGPEVVWKYIFSGNESEFNEILKNNLSENDYNTFIKELNKSPFDENPDHKKINEIIKNLYRNMYNEDITENKDIYDFYNNYIEKNYFKNQNQAITRVISCDALIAVKLGVAKYTDLYEYKKEISVNEFIEYINKFKSTRYYLDNNHDSNELLLSKNGEEFICFYDSENMKVIFYVDGERQEYSLNIDSINSLNKEYKFIYKTMTINKQHDYDNKASDILISTNDRFKCHGLDTIYRVRSMEERFKDQSIDKITLQNSENII